MVGFRSHDEQYPIAQVRQTAGVVNGRIYAPCDSNSISSTISQIK